LVIPKNTKGIVLSAHGSGSSRHSPGNRYVGEVLHEKTNLVPNKAAQPHFLGLSVLTKLISGSIIRIVIRSLSDPSVKE
jgi:hypothetical protein